MCLTKTKQNKNKNIKSSSLDCGSELCLVGRIAYQVQGTMYRNILISTKLTGKYVFLNLEIPIS